MSSDLAWLAGIIDGEGYIGFNRANGQWSLQIANTDRAIIDAICGVLDGLGIRYYIAAKHPQKPTHREAWTITVSGWRRLAQLVDVPLRSIKAARLVEAITDGYERASTRRERAWKTRRRFTVL